MADKIQIMLEVDASKGTAALKSFTKEVDSGSKAMADAAKKSSDWGGSLSTLKSAFAALSLGYVAKEVYAFAVAAEEASRKTQGLTTAFTFIAGNAQAGAKELEWLRLASDDLGISFYGAAEAYKGIAAAAKQTSISNEAVRTVFVGVASAATALGLSSEDTKGALLALSQMISKGTVSAEELRQQLGERLPGAFSIAAKSMGMTEAAFSKMLETGGIATSDFLPKFGAAMKKEFGGAAEQASEAEKSVKRLTTAFDDLDKAVGNQLSPGMTRIREELAGVVLELTAAVKGTGSFSDAWQRFISGYSSAPQSFADAKQQLANVNEEIKRVQGFIERGQAYTFSAAFGFKDSDLAKLAELQVKSAQLSEDIEIMTKRQALLALANDKTTDSFLRMSEAQKKVADAFSKLFDDTQELTTKLANIGNPFGSYAEKEVSALQKYRDTLAKMPEEIAKDASLSTQYQSDAEKNLNLELAVIRGERGKQASDIARDAQNKINDIGLWGVEQAREQLRQELDDMRQKGVSAEQIAAYAAAQNIKINEDEAARIYEINKKRYDDLAKLTAESVDLERELARATMDETDRAVDEIKQKYDEREQKLGDMLLAGVLSEQQYAAQIVQLEKGKNKEIEEATKDSFARRLAKETEALNQSEKNVDAYINNLKAKLKTDLVSGWEVAFAEITLKQKSFGELSYEAWKESYSAMVDYFQDSFVAIVKGDWEGLDDAFESFTDAIIKAWMRMLAEMVAQWTAANIASLFDIKLNFSGGGVSLGNVASTGTSLLGSLGGLISGTKTVAELASSGGISGLIGTILGGNPLAGLGGEALMGEALGSIGLEAVGAEAGAAMGAAAGASMLAVMAAPIALIAGGGVLAGMLNASQDTSPEEARQTIADNVTEIGRLTEVMKVNQEVDFSSTIAALVDEMYMMADRAGYGRDQVDALVASLDPLAAGAASVGAHMAEVNKAVADATQSVAALAETSWGMSTGMADLTDQLFGFAEGLGLGSEMTTSLESGIMDLVAQFQQGLVTTEQFGTYLDTLFQQALSGTLESVQGLSEALGSIPSEISTTVSVNTVYASGTSDLVSAYSGGEIPTGHKGGVVAPWGIGANPVLKFHSGGEVPALLLSGEGVLNRRAMRRIGSDGLNSLNSGGSFGGDSYINVTIVTPDNAVLEKRVEKLARGPRPAQMQINLNRRGGRPQAGAAR